MKLIVLVGLIDSVRIERLAFVKIEGTVSVFRDGDFEVQE